MRVLLTGFEPFGGAALNPSMLAVAEIARQPRAGLSLHTTVLPVRYAEAWPALQAAIEATQPGLLLMTGLAGGRSGLTIERLAINLDDSAAPDNAGERRVETTILARAPAAYFATTPVAAMAAASRAAGVEASVSLSAGTFLCNHALYRACHHAATHQRTLRCGFVHLPWLPEQAAAHPGEPSLALAAMVVGLRAVLATAVGWVSAALPITARPDDG